MRSAIVLALLLVGGSALADPMNADAARRFVIGKLFAFNCYDGSHGAGRIYSDGSVIGSIQFQGAGPTRNLWLPAGTLRVKGEAVCASLRGMPFEPCFNLNRTDERSFRGTVSGFGFAYCDFTRHNSGVASLAIRPRSGQPLPLHATAMGRGAE
jgi:hypothetical protein